MNKNRAKEIAQSPVMEHVTYNGEPIYIEHVDEQTNKAFIHLLKDPEQPFEVNISSLKEVE